MQTTPVHMVTGAFGYSGRYIARELLNTGVQVRTLTHSPNRANPFAGQVEAFPYSFENPARLTEMLRGVSVLYNTYWIRFNHAKFCQTDAVANTLVLFEAARAAGVKRIVHVSITNPSEDSPLEYFRGKARLERALMDSGLAYSILRPTVLFGDEDILINNIAWILRRFPVFPVFGDGQYRLQPIFVEDLAKLAVREANGAENRIIDAIGPETFTYRDLVTQLGRIIGKPRPVVAIQPLLGYFMGKIAGALLGDVLITRAEIAGLMADLLYANSPPAGETKLTNWVRAHANALGVRYASELARRADRFTAYEKL